MLFNSFEFVLFFLVFLAVFWGSPRAARPGLLLLASYVFYASWKPVYLLLLLATTAIDYTTARMMAATERPDLRLAALRVALVLNIGILAVLKYGNFATANLDALLAPSGLKLMWNLQAFVLPVGISFYTFQSIGYSLDVYFRRVPAERNLLTYAQYVAFFPQLVAGPIERAAHMLPQFRRSARWSIDHLAPGLWLIGWGLFKKMCIADQVAPFVAAIYANPSQYSGTYTLIATVLFSIQIYCDFSGYSSIARGVARLMDFELMINFRQPYFAGSLSEFWARWHISLSTWFRDYLYIPLGGNRVARWRQLLNLLIVFAISGLWHGASWCFVLWGAVHGIGLVIERLLRWRFERPFAVAPATVRAGVKIGGRLATLGLVLAAWVFFRANTLADALVILQSWGQYTTPRYGVFKLSGLASFEMLLCGVFIPTLFAVEAVIARAGDVAVASVVGERTALLLSVLLTWTILLFGVFGRHEFIYFQF